MQLLDEVMKDAHAAIHVFEQNRQPLRSYKIQIAY